MGTNRFFNPGTSLDVANGTVSDETDINDVVDDVTDSFNLVEDDITLLAAEVFTGGILDNTGLTTPVTLGYTAAVPPATPAEYSVTLVNDAAANVNSISTDGTLAGNTDTDIPTEKAVKTYIDTGLALKLDDTQLSTQTDLDDGSGASDSKVPSQLAVKTYADTKVTGALSTEVDLDDGAGASDAKVPSQLAVKTYVDTGLATKPTATLDTSTDLDGAGASDAKVPSQLAVKTYVDSQTTAQALAFQGDSGGALSIDLGTETLIVTGGTGITTSGAANTLTIAIDNTETATLTDSQVLTNKTLTSPVVNTGISGTAVLDDDTFATASNTTIATSESIKAYVDTSISTAADPKYRNLILNQEMLVSQARESVAFTMLTSSERTADRWFCQKNNTDELVATVQKIGTSLTSSLFGYSRAYLKCVTTTKETATAADEFVIPFNYKFTQEESNDLVLNGTSTLSFDFKSNMPDGSIFSIAFYGLVGANSASYVQDFTYTTSGAVQRVVLDAPFATTTSGFMVAAYGGTNYQSTSNDTWEYPFGDAICSPSATNWTTYADNTYVSLSSVQINRTGSETLFERKSYDDYLLECSSYYWKSWDQGVGVGTAATENNAIISFKNAPGGASIDLYHSVAFPRTMYTTPTVTLYSTQTPGTSGNITNVTDGADVASTADLITSKGFNKVDTGATTIDDGDRIAFHYIADTNY